MPKNSLFNFINHYVLPSTQPVIEGSALILATNMQRERYYRLELDHSSNIKVDGYRLRDHHISVYELKISEAQGQYHYTAHFMDDDDKEYQLHVYFNANDDMTKPPVFSIKNDMGTFHPIAVDALNEQFVRLARSSCKKLTTTLRKQLTFKVQE